MKLDVNKIAISSLSLICLLHLNSCSKKAEEPLAKADIKIGQTTTMGLPAPDLDWDNLNVFDYGPNETIAAPWAGGIGRSFPTDYLNDYKKTDGWELYYNSFNKIKKAQEPFFVLYNKYRGIMRLYYFLAPQSAVSTDHVTFQLSLKGTLNNSSILNFEQSEVNNLSVSPTSISKVQNELVVQSGSWYAEEFELSYDPILKQQSYVANQLQWTMYSTSVDKISLQGTEKGTIDGTIQIPQPTQSLFGQLLKGAMSVGLGGLGTLATGSKIATSFFSKSLGPLKLSHIKDGVEEAGKGALKDGGKSIFNAVLGAIKGNNGGPSFSEQKINLKINTDITLTGNIQHSPIGMFNPVIFISNTQGLSDTAPDYIPNYTKSLGLFRITGTPNVSQIISQTKTEGNPREYFSNNAVTLDKTSFVLEFNPDIFNTSSNGATHTVPKTEVVVTGLTGRGEFMNEVALEYMSTGQNAINEIVDVHTGTSILKTYTGALQYFQKVQNAFLRVTFDVIPNDGSPKTTIIKTFKANFNTTVKVMPGTST